MQMDKVCAKLNLKSFIKGLDLANHCNTYETIQDEKTENLILLDAQIFGNGILPSKRYGNAVALATELNFTKAANFLCEHSDEADLDTTDIISDDGLFTSLIKEFLFVQVANGVSSIDKNDLDEQSKVILRSMVNMLAGHDEKKAKKIKKMIYNQNKNKTSFLFSTLIYEGMQAYTLEDNEEYLREAITNPETGKVNCFLPSVRKGNALALALETNNYKAAEYIYDHAEEFGIDTDHVIKSNKEDGRWSAHDELVYSLITYDYDEEEETIKFAMEHLGVETANLYSKLAEEKRATLDRLIDKLDVSKEELKQVGYEKAKTKKMA